MGNDPNVTSIIAILIGATGTPPPEPDKEFGAAMKAFNLGSEDPFGQDLTPRLLDLLGVHPDHGVF